MRAIVVLLLSLAGLILAQNAWAQEAGPGGGTKATDGAAPSAPPSAANSADSSVQVQEVVVTAQRRSENLQKVPLSVTAVSADSLKDRQINDINDLTLAAPSVQTELGGFSIRGVGTLSSSPVVEGSVAVAIDEISIGQPSQVIDVFNDVARVEVLNGPQGLLFGRNSSAGLVNIITNKPMIGRFTDEASVEAGSRVRPGEDFTKYALVRDAVNVPINEDSALRINGIYSYDPSVETDNHPTMARQENVDKEYGGRVKYLNYVTDNLSLYLIGELLEFHGAKPTTMRSIGSGPSLEGPLLAAEGVKPGPNNFLFSSDGPYYEDKLQKGLQGTVSYELGHGWTVSDIAGWKGFIHNATVDGDGTAVDILNTSANFLRFTQYSNELRVTLPKADRLSGQFGLYYFHGTTHSFGISDGGYGVPPGGQSSPPYCVGPPPAQPATGCPVDNTAVIGRDVTVLQTNASYAGFGQFTYLVADGLSLIAGGRLTNDELRIISSQDKYSYTKYLEPPGTFNQSTTDNNFSWKVGGQYQMTPQDMAYLTYGRGYKGPGANTDSADLSADLVVGPETSDDLELGEKSSFFDRRLVVDVSLFHTQFHNLQVQAYNQASTSFITQNAAEVTSEGGELTLVGKPTRGLTLSESGAFVHSKFDSFPGAQCYPGQPTPGCATTETFNAAGIRTPSTPRLSSTFDVRYEMPLWGTLAAFVDANWYYRSPLNYNVNAAQGAEVGTINILGSSIGVETNKLQASLFCKNCTNVHYPLYIGNDPIDGTVNVNSFRQQFGPNSVRSVGVSVSYRY